MFPLDFPHPLFVPFWTLLCLILATWPLVNQLLMLLPLTHLLHWQDPLALWALSPMPQLPPLRLLPQWIPLHPVILYTPCNTYWTMPGLPL